MLGKKISQNALILGFIINLLLVTFLLFSSSTNLNIIEATFQTKNAHLENSFANADALARLYSSYISLQQLDKDLLSPSKKEFNDFKQRFDTIEDNLNKYTFLKFNNQNINTDFESLQTSFNRYKTNVLSYLDTNNQSLGITQADIDQSFQALSDNYDSVIAWNTEQRAISEDKNFLLYNKTQDLINQNKHKIWLIGGLTLLFGILLFAFNSKFIMSGIFRYRKMLEKEFLLGEINRSIRESFNLEDVLNAIKKELITSTNATNCFIVNDINLLDSLNDQNSSILNMALLPFLEKHRHSKSVIAIDKLTPDHLPLKDVQSMEKAGVKGIIISPIIYQERVLASVVLTKNNTKKWGKEEVEIVKLVSIQSATVLQQSILFQQIKAYNKKLRENEKILTTKNILLKDKEEQLKLKNDSLVKAKCELEYANIELLESNIKLKELDEMKNNFISTISHEIKTPITCIKGSLGLVLNGIVGDVNDSTTMFLNLCYRNADKLINLINELLDISILESGKIALNKQDIKLNDLINDSVERISAEAIEKNIKIFYDGNVSGDIYADKKRIEQVFYNILSNAIKFSDPRSDEEPSIKIETLTIDAYTQFRIIDNGIGIPEEKHAIIFEKFIQVDNSSTRTYDGTGLGLAICKAIVEAHRGHIWVESKDSKGTTISFTIGNKEIQEVGQQESSVLIRVN